MKSVYRWLCGELNGDLFQNIQIVANTMNKQFEDLVSSKKNTVFKLESEDIRYNEVPVSNEDFIGIAKVAGVFPPFVTAESNIGSIVGSPSHIVDGTEFSDRGLFDMDGEAFRFFRTVPNVQFATDISTLATERLRMTVVPLGTPILGYIAEGTTVFNPDGTIIPGSILTSPPDGVAWMPYYGDKYLFASETFVVSSVVDIETHKALFEAMQTIRYSSPSIAALEKITTTILKDYVYNIRITRSGYRFLLRYTINEGALLDQKTRRLAVWKRLIGMKYKLFVFQEEAP